MSQSPFLNHYSYFITIYGHLYSVSNVCYLISFSLSLYSLWQILCENFGNRKKKVSYMNTMLYPTSKLLYVFPADNFIVCRC